MPRHGVARPIVWPSCAGGKRAARSAGFAGHRYSTALLAPGRARGIGQSHEMRWTCDMIGAPLTAQMVGHVPAVAFLYARLRLRRPPPASAPEEPALKLTWGRGVWPKSSGKGSVACGMAFALTKCS